MKKLLLLFTFALTSPMLKSQAVPTAFEDWKTPSGTLNFFYKNIVKTDGLGNVYSAGATMNGAGNLDILVAKYDIKGHVLWQITYTGSGNGTDVVADMVVTSSYVYFTGSVTNYSSTPQVDAITARLVNATGAVSWATTYSSGGAGNIAGGKAIEFETSSASIIVTGIKYTSGYSDILTIRYNASGVQQWAKTYNYIGYNDAGFKTSSTNTSVTVTGAVQVGTASYYSSNVLTYAMSTGSLTGTSTSTAFSTTDVDAVTDFATDATGNVYIIGANAVTGQGNDWYVQKVNPNNLTVAWTYTYNGPSNLDDAPRGVQVDGANNVYVVGYSTSSSQGRNIILTKLNGSGNAVYTKTINGTFNGDDEAADIVLDASTNIYLTGYKTVGTNNKNYYTTKFNSAGTQQWEIEMDGKDLNDYATNMALDTLNNVVITGQSETSPGVFSFVTVKYVQKDIINPTDFSGESTHERNWYFQNMGQLRDINDSLVNDVIFHTDATSPSICIKKNSMNFTFVKVDTLSATPDTLQRVDMVFNNASTTTKAYPMETQKFAISYFNGTGRDFPSVHGNAKLITPNIYNNIDLMYSSSQSGIKYYFIVKPGGNPKDITIDFNGATSCSLNVSTNELSLNTPIGSLSFVRPIAYQLTATNSTVAVTGWTPDWQTNGASNKYKFNSGVYTTSLTLVIMVDRGVPATTASASNNMMWNTYQGGNSDDYMTDLKVDRYGNIYTLTDTWSATYYLPPTTSFNAAQTGRQATQLMKYDKLGVRVKQIYIGSATNTPGAALAIIKDSVIVVVGSNCGSNLSTPVLGNPTGAFTTTVGPSWIMKFKSDFTAITWRTRYPGAILDADAKNNGDLYLSVNSPTAGVHLVNEAGATNIGTTGIIQYSGLVAKFDQNGSDIWASYIGVTMGSSYNSKASIKVDTAKNEVYVFGVPENTDNWIGYNNYGTFLHSSPIGGADAYIKKLNINDSMTVSTFVGGNKFDNFEDATFLTNGDLCFVGTTTSTDTSNIIYNPHDGSYISKVWDNSKGKGWVTKFSHNFVLKWMTLYGDTLMSTDFRAATTDPLNSTLLLAGYTTGMLVVGAGSYYIQACDNLGSGAFVSFDGFNRISWSTSMGVPTFAPESGIMAAAYNPKNANWDFAGHCAANGGYPWVSYPGSYNQDFNQGSGSYDCTTGRFAAVTPVVGINEIKHVDNSDVLLFPNPSHSYTNLYFRTGITGNVKITICNSIGQIVEVRSVNTIEGNSTILFNTSTLADGIYYINISSEKVSHSIKFANFN